MPGTYATDLEEQAAHAVELVFGNGQQVSFFVHRGTGGRLVLAKGVRRDVDESGARVDDAGVHGQDARVAVRDALVYTPVSVRGRSGRDGTESITSPSEPRI